MKKIYKKMLLLVAPVAFILLLASPTKSKACIDTTNTIFVTCDYDTTFNEILIRVNNMNLFGSPQGAFCTCGISNFTDIFTNILYVSFVEEATTTPLAGFVPWTTSSPATSAWNSVQSGDWDAFLAETTAGGLPNGDPVDLLIRASLPLGYTFSILDSNLIVTSIGTDEYDNVTNSISGSHTNLLGFFSSQITYVTQPLSYFANVDNLITSVDDKKDIQKNISVYPNPVKENLTIEVELTQQANVEVFATDLLGNRVNTISTKKMNAGINKLYWKPEKLSNGIYLLNIKTDNSIQVQKFIINK